MADEGRPGSSSAAKPARGRRRSSGVIVPHQPDWRGRAIAALVFATIQTVAATLRFTWRHRSELFDGTSRQSVIFAIWHNRLALSVVMYRRHVLSRQPDRRMAAMVSASRDGAVLARILERFGVQPVRGSTSRRGPQALLELTSWAEQGFDLAITPDGPRGPRYVVQEGVISLAQLTQQPIVPVACNLNWKVRARSWDQFQIPLPFARCAVETGEPIWVPRAASEGEREKLREQLQQALRALVRD